MIDRPRWFVLLLLCWLPVAPVVGQLAAPAGSAGAGPAVRATLDRPTVVLGDSLTLTIERAGTGGGLAPDLSPLDADFEVGGTSVSSEINIINGQRSDRTRYHVLLTPRREGTLTVPALRLGAEQTAPLRLTVEPVPSGATGAAGDDLFVEVALEGDPQGLVLNQQVPLVVRAFARPALLEYELRLPPLDGVLLTRLGERESTAMTRRNGEPYRLFEWRFTLSPERSGTLAVGPFVFAARVASPPAPNAPQPPVGRLFRDPLFDRMLAGTPFGFDRGRPVRAQSAPLTLTVAGLPGGFTAADWLPARSVTLRDDWSSAPPTLAVGEPATRTITITVDGLTGNQIPTLALPLPAGARGYPGATENATETDGVGVTGSSRQQQTLIPTQAGSLVLPPVSVPWWDTVTGERREAVLPALRLSVADAPATTTASPVAPPAPAAADAAPDPVGGEAGGRADHGARWLIAGTGLLALSLVALGWVWWRHRGAVEAGPDRAGQGQAAAATPSTPVPLPLAIPDPASARARLREACVNGDPAAAAKALLALGAALWPATPPANLAALAALAGAGRAPTTPDRGLTAAVHALERALYAPNAGAWDGAALWAAVTAGLPARPSGSGGAGEVGDDGLDLAPLYPER